MPQAQRLYYDDSQLRSFNARVTDIREYARTDGQSLWQIALDRTAFYPTSGGQPFDRGSLTAQARSGTELVAEIEDVMEDEQGEVWHSTRKPLVAGTEVRGEIDWVRRLDHMQQHSGQHLLSAVFAQDTGARTISFHLGEGVCTIDLATESSEEQGVLAASIPNIEQQVNRLVSEDVPVTIRSVSGDQAKALLAEGKLRKLPPRDGPIRLIEMAGIDLNACGGTHVRSLGQIGSLLIRGTERTKKALRVEFVCGLRAVASARKDLSILSEAAGILSVGRGSLRESVERLLHENKLRMRSQQRLQEELAHYHAVQLAVEEHIEQGLRMVYRTFVDRDDEYIRQLASKLVSSVPQTVALLVSIVREPASVVLACTPSLHCGCGARLKDALARIGLRGGGSPDMAQATLPRAEVQVLAERLRDQITSELRVSALQS